MESSKCCIKNPTVTVVIPAYNVENYIEKCVESILKQSYTCSEIIVVDDGSTDKTPMLIDKIAKCNPLIRVIHKENAGVSSARNDGIELSHGDYIVFVDGDDWLAPDFVDYMISLVRESDADFGLSINCFTQKDEPQVQQAFKKILSPVEGAALLLSPTVIVGCWNKIYKKSMLINQGIRFSTQLFYGEGLNFITLVAQKSNRIAVGNRKVYYYRRNNAMSATTKFNIKSIYNGEQALNMIENSFAEHSEELDDMMLLHRAMYNFGAVVKIINNNKKSEYKENYTRWMSFNRKNIIKIVKSRYISLYRKGLLLGGCVLPRLIALLDTVRRKRIAANSVGDIE